MPWIWKRELHLGDAVDIFGWMGWRMNVGLAEVTDGKASLRVEGTYPTWNARPSGLNRTQFHECGADESIAYLLRVSTLLPLTKEVEIHVQSISEEAVMLAITLPRGWRVALDELEADGSD